MVKYKVNITVIVDARNKHGAEDKAFRFVENGIYQKISARVLDHPTGGKILCTKCRHFFDKKDIISHPKHGRLCPDCYRYVVGTLK